MGTNSLLFNGNVQALTLGVELELQVLDGNSLLLTPRAHEIIDQLSSLKVKPEFFQSSLEVVSGVCKSVNKIEEDIQETLSLVKLGSKALNLKLSSTGTHPEADYRDRLVTPSKRYEELLDRNQWIIRRMAVYGMHIHVGMKSGDECIRFQNLFLHLVPHLIALSASSPFWQKMRTGLSSTRPTMYEAMPSSGMPHIVKTWKGFEKIYSEMIQTRSINDFHDLWLDLRPSPSLGTLEIRICDQPATTEEAMAIVAFVHALAYWYQENCDQWEAEHKKVIPWILRENKWRAIRFGLHAEIIDTTSRINVKLLDNLHYWINRLSPWVKRLGYEHYFQTIENMLERGNSSDRQLEVFQRTHNLHEVAKHNVFEFENGVSW